MFRYELKPLKLYQLDPVLDALKYNGTYEKREVDIKIRQAEKETQCLVSFEIEDQIEGTVLQSFVDGVLFAKEWLMKV